MLVLCVGVWCSHHQWRGVWLAPHQAVLEEAGSHVALAYHVERGAQLCGVLLPYTGPELGQA